MAIKSIRPTITTIILTLLAMPVVADNAEKLIKETNSFSSGSDPEDSDKITTETRGLSGWKRREDSCHYAEQAAKRKAESACNKKKGIHLNFINAQCFDCNQSAYYHEWYCSSRVIAQCSSMQKVDSPSLINKLRGLLLDSKGNSYTESNNPCTKDANTMACKNYRKAKKKVGSVRD